MSQEQLNRIDALEKRISEKKELIKNIQIAQHHVLRDILASSDTEAGLFMLKFFAALIIFFEVSFLFL